MNKLGLDLDLSYYLLNGLTFKVTLLLLLFHWQMQCTNADLTEFTKREILKFRNDVKTMFYHAYDGYMTYAYPFDELRPLTCDGHDTWGSYSLTLIDALDTLAVMDNKTEFQKVVKLITERSDFEADINVSVFETNIRIVGGLLSGHLMSHKMGVALEKNWPCDGPLLRLAADAATRLLPAFDTPTGMPYGTVNLKYGVPDGETPVTCAAGVGTYIMEFGTLSRLTGNSIFENVALRAMHGLWERRSRLDLIGNHIDVLTGLWTGHDSGIGAGVDSFFEYLVKASFLLQRPELMAIFNKAREAIDKHLRHDDWYFWKSMQRGQVTMTVFQSLEAFWPGVLTLIGDIEYAQKTLFNYHQVVKQYGFTPEFYNIPQANAYSKRGGFPLRPEFIESLMYLYQATRDHTFLRMGADLISSINHSAKTDCGYATIENVVDHTLDNRMESFFLAETTKYLYLLFHEDHWLHSDGGRGKPHVVGKRHCIIEAGGYFYNTEAHPIDSGALACCYGPEEDNLIFLQEDLVKIILDPTKMPIKDSGRPMKLLKRGKELVNHSKKEVENNNVDGINTDVDSPLESSTNINKSEILDESITKEIKNNINLDNEIENSDTEKSIKPNKENLEDFINKLNKMYENLEANLEPKRNLKYPSVASVSTPAVVVSDQLSESTMKTITIINDAIESSTEKEIDEDVVSANIGPSNDLDSKSTTNSQKLQSNSEDTEMGVGNIETIITENDTSNQYEVDKIVNIKEEFEKRKDGDKEKLPWDPRFSSLGESIISERVDPQEPLAEMSGIATSVSSSKFTAPEINENRIIQKELPTNNLPKKLFSIAYLEEKLLLDLALRANLTSLISYSVLNCPVASFSQSLSFKGQMVNVDP